MGHPSSLAVAAHHPASPAVTRDPHPPAVASDPHPPATAARQPASAVRQPAGAGQRLGAHAQTSGGLARAVLAHVDAIDASAVQVYLGNPRGWALPPGDPAADATLRAGCVQRDVAIYVHASLLVNLGSPTRATVDRSVGALRYALARGAGIGVAAVVFHAGSAVDPAHRPAALRQVRDRLLPLLETAADSGWPKLLVEPSAGGGQCLASRVEQLGDYLDLVDRHPWLGVCFDTCHAWAAGHNLAAPGGMTATLDALAGACGADRLLLVHANDSKDQRGSVRDRHESLGRGLIGEAPFAELLAHPAVAGVPLIVETPSEGHAGHRRDLDILRRLRTGAAGTPAGGGRTGPAGAGNGTGPGGDDDRTGDDDR